jgi:hypothetical protein
MEAQLPDKPNEVETYKNEEKDQAVEWHCALCNMFLIPRAHHPPNFLTKNLEEIVNYALKYCMLHCVNSQMQQTMPTSITIGQL